jgi:hypothetical protein
MHGFLSSIIRVTGEVVGIVIASLAVVCMVLHYGPLTIIGLKMPSGLITRAKWQKMTMDAMVTCMYRMKVNGLTSPNHYNQTRDEDRAAAFWRGVVFFQSEVEICMKDMVFFCDEALAIWLVSSSSLMRHLLFGSWVAPVVAFFAEW